MSLVAPLVVLAILGSGRLTGAQESESQYRSRILAWRESQQADLMSDSGWLSVAGLFWLSEGENSVGSAESCQVRLPTSAPAHVGTLTRSGNSVTLQITAPGSVQVDGKDATSVDMGRSHAVIGDVTLTVIQRGSRVGIRMYDKNSKARREFTGCRWFSVDPAYRIEAKFVPYQPPKMIPITNVLGDTSMTPSPGYVEFKIGSQDCRLDAEPAGNGLFFNFSDASSGRTTYPAGRFLDAPKPEDGLVLLDFNRATNPPCAFTSFATCPLPPKGNHLSAYIRAGELVHHPD